MHDSTDLQRACGWEGSTTEQRSVGRKGPERFRSGEGPQPRGRTRGEDKRGALPPGTEQAGGGRGGGGRAPPPHTPRLWKHYVNNVINFVILVDANKLANKLFGSGLW